MIDRRTFLAAGAAVATTAITGFPAIAAPPTPLRIGFLHGLSSDAHLRIGEHLGSFAAEGLATETVQFITGLEAYQALVGGSVDLVTTGAVISNFPARGQGKAFLINAIEHATAQLWVHPDQGVATIADLKGKRIATTRGTTAHYFLYKLLAANGLDANTDVEIVHQQMGNAVTSFISGAVPVVATWVPFDSGIAKAAPTAKLLATAREYPDAAILNGWSAGNAFYAERKDVLERFIRAWLPANAYIIAKRDEALEYLHGSYYKDFTLAELQTQYDTARWLPAAEWEVLYRDGKIAEWLDRVTAFNVAVGAFKDPLPASTYFDPSLFLKVAAAA